AGRGLPALPGGTKKMRPRDGFTFLRFRRTLSLGLKSMNHKSPVSRSGRFSSGPAAEVGQFTESVSFDWRLWRQDLAGSKAHAAMLQKIGVLSRPELAAICRGLDVIGKEIEAGKFRWRRELEDVHMNIEFALTQRVPAGAKLHT